MTLEVGIDNSETSTSQTTFRCSLTQKNSVRRRRMSKLTHFFICLLTLVVHILVRNGLPRRYCFIFPCKFCGFVCVCMRERERHSVRYAQLSWMCDSYQILAMRSAESRPPTGCTMVRTDAVPENADEVVERVPVRVAHYCEYTLV
jgi:hypothetical protein